MAQIVSSPAAAAANPANLPPDQKAARELVALLLDARSNLIRRKHELEAARIAKELAAVKDIANPKATIDQLLVPLRNIGDAIAQAQKDLKSVAQAQKIVNDQLKVRRKDCPALVRSVYEEKISLLEGQLGSMDLQEKPLQSEVNILKAELSKLPKAKAGAQGNGQGAKPKRRGNRKKKQP